jgi:hypothetical protein
MLARISPSEARLDRGVPAARGTILGLTLLLCGTANTLGQTGASWGNKDPQSLRACAAFDLLQVTAIEDASERDPTSADVVTAAFAVFRARQLCRDGHFVEAFDLYSRIAPEAQQARWLK